MGENRLAFWLIMLHFLKREFESIFVHHFSLSYMPLRNLFKNSAHYHILSGFLIAYFTYGPWFDATSDKAIRSNLYSTVLVLLWTVRGGGGGCTYSNSGQNSQMAWFIGRYVISEPRMMVMLIRERFLMVMAFPGYHVQITFLNQLLGFPLLS